MTFLGGRTLLALITAVPQGTLQDARIRIEVRADTAHVDARYRVMEAGDSVRLHAPRTASQRTVFDPPFRDRRLRLDTLPGAFRLTALGGGRAVTLDLWYAVSGNLSRIPLFVPDAPTAPGRSRVTIVVLGLPPERVARHVVPRFTREPGGAWRAAPDHLPSFVALVRPAHALPVPALAQWTIIFIAAGGTLAWVLTQLAARRRK